MNVYPPKEEKKRTKFSSKNPKFLKTNSFNGTTHYQLHIDILNNFSYKIKNQQQSQRLYWISLNRKQADILGTHNQKKKKSHTENKNIFRTKCNNQNPKLKNPHSHTHTQLTKSTKTCQYRENMQ